MKAITNLKQIEHAVGRYELALQQLRRTPKERPKLITISRQVGSGGREIAEKICHRLGCQVWGREILDALTSQAGGDYQARMFKALDEGSQGIIDELVSDFFGQASRHTYYYLLPRAIFTIAQGDAVILGRGANLILPAAYHVRITASEEKRITALMAREGLAHAAARERLRDTEHQRETFVKEFSRTIIGGRSRSDFDLTVNTDRLSTDAAASIILHGFELFGASGAGKH